VRKFGNVEKHLWKETLHLFRMKKLAEVFDYRDIQLLVLGASAFFQSVSSPSQGILGSVVQRGTYGFESQGIEV